MKSPLIKPLLLGLSVCLFGGCSVVGDLVSSAIFSKKKSSNHNQKSLEKHSTPQQAKQEQSPQKPSVSPQTEMWIAIEAYNRIAKSHANVGYCAGVVSDEFQFATDRDVFKSTMEDFKRLAVKGNAEAYRYLGLMDRTCIYLMHLCFSL